MRRVASLLSAALLALGLVSIATPAGAAPTAVGPADTGPIHSSIAGGYNPIPLARVFNTAVAGKLAPAVIRKVPVGGHGGVPSDAVAVEVNVTVRTPAKAGSLSVFAGTATYKGIATVSFGASVTEQRMITANLGTDGSLNLRNNVAGANLDVILVVVGYYSGGAATTLGSYHPVPIQRVYDPSKAGTVPVNGSRSVPIGGRGSIPSATDGLVVVMNLTVVSPSRAGNVGITLGSMGQASVQFMAGTTTQTMVTVDVDTISQADNLWSTTPAPVSVILDVVGYFNSADSAAPGGYTTVTDEDEIGHSTLAQQSTRTYPILPTAGATDIYGLPRLGVWAVKLEISVLAPSRAGAIGVSPTDEATDAATISFRPGDTISYDVTVRVDPTGQISLSNTSIGRMQVSIRAVGYYTYSTNPLTFTGRSVAVPRTDFGLISCATPAFCVAGQVLGLAAVFNGTSWTRPAPISGLTRLGGIACPAVNDCFAVGAGTIYHFDGTSWSLMQTDPHPSGGIGLISCTDADFCLATFGQRFATWDGTEWTWGSGSATGLTGGIGALSCATPTFCVGLDGSDLYTEFNGSTWTTPSGLATVNNLHPYLSCPAAQHCVVITMDNKAMSFDGTTWTSTSLPALLGRQTGLSCSSTTACVELDAFGRSRFFNGTTWSNPTPMGGSGTPSGISCLSTGQCVALSAQTGSPSSSTASSSQTYDGSAWAAPITLTTGFGRLSGFTCPTAGFCVAVTSAGLETQFDGSTWSFPKSVVATGSLADVSCADATSCVAIQADGVAVFEGGTWTGLTQIDAGNALTSVSCAPTAGCVVGDDHGQAFRYSGGSWSRPTTLGTAAVSAVSCASDGSCLALFADGTASQYRNGSWFAVLGNSITAAWTASCASVNYCLISGPSGTAAFNGSSWSAVPGVYTEVSCTGVAKCQNYEASTGTLIAWDGHYRSRQVGTVYSEGAPVRLACPTTSQCLLSDGNQTVAEFEVA